MRFAIQRLLQEKGWQAVDEALWCLQHEVTLSPEDLFYLQCALLVRVTAIADFLFVAPGNQIEESN